MLLHRNAARRIATREKHWDRRLRTHLYLSSLRTLRNPVGLVPALKTSRTDLQETLNQGGRGGSGIQHRAQGALVVIETALALVLLIGAGLLIRSLTHLWKVDPGFDPANVITFGISLPPSMLQASPESVRAAFRELDNRLRGIPRVRAVSQTWGAVPLSGDDEQLFWIDGHQKPVSDNEMNWAIDYIVEPQYLAVMGIPLKQGRSSRRKITRMRHE